MRSPRDQCSGRAWQQATLPHRLAWAAAGRPCALCGGSIDYRLRHPNKWALTVDHIHAVRDGGPPLDPANWQPAHQRCNSERSARETNAKRARRTRSHSSLAW